DCVPAQGTFTPSVHAHVRHTPCAAANPAIALRLQSTPPAGRVAGSLGCNDSCMKGSRSIVVLVVVASLMMVGAYVVWHPFRVASLRRRAALIKPGDDKNHVRSVLGRPGETFGGF